MMEPKPRSVKAFEHACILDDGSWPGPGQQDWLMRWRGAGVDEDDPYDWVNEKYDDDQQEIKFEIGEDGKLSLSAIMIPGRGGGLIGRFEAVKTGDEPKCVSDAGLPTQWSKYKYEKGGRWVIGSANWGGYLAY